MPRDNFPPCLGPLTTTRHPNAPSPEASHEKRVRRGKKKRVPSRSPGPSQNAPGPQRLAHGLPQCLEVKLCWVPSRVLGEARDSRAGHSAKRPRAPVMQRGCIARFPACPAPPQARTLTDAGGPGSGSAVAAARPGTAPAFRAARRAGERAGELRARARSDGPVPAVGGKRG